MSAAVWVIIRSAALAAALVLATPMWSAPIPGGALLWGQAPADGWMGVRLTYEITTTGAFGPGAPGRAREVRISEVVAGGPAAQAGLRAGDRLLRVNDQEAWQAVEEGALANLRSGDRIRFLVARGPGDPNGLAIEVVAGARPPQSLTIARLPGAVLGSDPAGDLARTTLLGLRRPPGTPRLMVQPWFQVDSLARLRGQLEGRVQGDALTQGAESTPILVYSMGQRVVLGAEVTPLNPGLASYFGVDSGLLVTRVLEGAPAERGGLLSGDVIQFVGGAPVATVETLRREAARGLQAPPLLLGIVRQGRSMELRIPR